MMIFSLVASIKSTTHSQANSSCGFSFKRAISKAFACWRCPDMASWIASFNLPEGTTSSVFNEKPLECEELDMSQNANPLIGILILGKLYMNFTPLDENDDARIDDFGLDERFPSCYSV